MQCYQAMYEALRQLGVYIDDMPLNLLIAMLIVAILAVLAVQLLVCQRNRRNPAAEFAHIKQKLKKLEALEHLPRQIREIECTQRTTLKILEKVVDVAVEGEKATCKKDSDNDTKLAAIERRIVELQMPPAPTQKLTPYTLAMSNIRVKATEPTNYPPPKQLTASATCHPPSSSTTPAATL